MRFSLAIVPAIVLGHSFPARAERLEFSGMHRDTVVEASVFYDCSITMPDVPCSLKRTSFGDVPIESSLIVRETGTRKATDVTLWFKDIFFASALESMKARYGEPTKDESKSKVNKTGGPYIFRAVCWRGYDEGAFACLTDGDDDEAALSINFGRHAPRPEPKVDF